MSAAFAFSAKTSSSASSWWNLVNTAKKNTFYITETHKIILKLIPDLNLILAVLEPWPK